LPSDILAAFLFAQLEQRQWVLQRRREVYERYTDALGGWAADNGVRLPVIPAGCESSWHMFFMIMPDVRSRDGLIAHLREREILAVFHYLPLSRSPMGRRLSPDDRCPVSESVSERLVRLPFFNTLMPDEHDEVIEAVRQFRV
jgi:dTDP-4-amino-4,6-dideoxygalactose transaminase